MLAQISKLVADSAENMKRSNVEAAGQQLREIKRLCREEPKSFKRKENGIQYKFNSKLPEAKSHLEINRSLVEGPSWSIPSMIQACVSQKTRKSPGPENCPIKLPKRLSGVSQNARKFRARENHATFSCKLYGYSPPPENTFWVFHLK